MASPIKNDKENQNEVKISKFADSTAFFAQAAKQNGVMKRFIQDLKSVQPKSNFKAALLDSSNKK